MDQTRWTYHCKEYDNISELHPKNIRETYVQIKSTGTDLHTERQIYVQEL